MKHKIIVPDGRRRVIVSDEFIKRLVEADLVPENCRRIIIDLEAQHPARLYYETFLDERILQVDLFKPFSITE